tara:strand:- start:791 stop:1258 length:468 start_codon:yes stop_codon:yes gene_type:complete
MSPECKAVLKSFAETYGMTMGDALYRCTRLLFHRQANFCDFLETQMDFNDIKVEGGSDKPCYGFLCNNCKRETACRTRVYDGVIQFKEELKRFVKPEGVEAIQRIQREAGQTCQDFPQKLKQNSVVKTAGITRAPRYGSGPSGLDCSQSQDTSLR